MKLMGALAQHETVYHHTQPFCLLQVSKTTVKEGKYLSVTWYFNANEEWQKLDKTAVYGSLKRVSGQFYSSSNWIQPSERDYIPTWRF